MVSPLRYPAFKGLKAREAAAVLCILGLMGLAGFRYSVPQVVFFSVTTFALVWGYWWIPLRPYWVPGVGRED
jgi:phosphatidylserine synthase